MKRYFQNNILPSLGKGLGMGLLLCVLCASCKGDYDDWAQPQHNDQDEPANVTMTVDVAAPAATIEIEALADADQVQVFVPVKVESNVDATYVLTLSDDKGNSKDLSVTTDGYISKEDLVNTVVEFFGKKQEERTLTGVLTALYVKDGSTMKVNSEKFTIKVLPAVPDLNYWIYGKQNNRDSKQKTLPLMPVTKKNQTVTTYFSGKLDTKMWSDDTFGSSNETYGATGGNKSTWSGEFSVGGGYICSPNEGWYTLTFDFATYQYSFTRLDNQAPTEYETISLIGEFNGWGDDLELTPVATSSNAWKSHCWYALDVELTAGELKFRANKAWDTNWGVSQEVKDNPYGTGTQDGPNLKVAAGKYNVYFNDITGEFLFIEQ